MKKSNFMRLFVLLTAFLFLSALFYRVSFAIVGPTYIKTAASSKVELRRYFEKAMMLFESGKYKEAITIFEKLIEIEEGQGQSYFTPFAEIYIDKAKSRMRELMILEDKKWEKMKEDVIAEQERIVGEEAEEAGQIKDTEEIEEVIDREERELLEIEKARRLIDEEEEKLAIERDTRKVLEREARILTGEAERVAVQIEQEEREKIAREETMKKQALLEAEREEKAYLLREVNNAHRRAILFYKKGNYPQSIIEFKKVRDLDPQSPLADKASDFIKKAQNLIEDEKKKELVSKMKAAKRAKIEMAKEEERKRIEQRKREILTARKERERLMLKKHFEEKLRAKKIKETIKRIEALMDDIRMRVVAKDFEEAGFLLKKAIEEFPDNKRFQDILHYIDLQKIRDEEIALKRAREITEEKMLLEVATKHLLPEEQFGVLEKKKKITTLVRVPEIRKRLKIPITVDFEGVELDYVLGFISDITGVNIIPSSEIDAQEAKVTIKIKDMPLEDALKYILKSQDLVYRIEEDAVWVATKGELDNEKIETRVYFLDQGLGKFAEFSGSFDEGEGASSSSTEVKTLKDLLDEVVNWPKDSKLTLDNRTGAFIVSNTPTNMEVIENLLYNLDVTPIQVLVEARFLEIRVTDTDELGFEWKLNSDWGLKQNNEKQNIHGLTSGSGARLDFTDFGSNENYGFNLTYQGILSHPQFQVAIHALQQKQDVKTLSAPRITTLNNQTATIEVIDEYIYPTRYEASLVQYDINGDGDFDDAGESEWSNIPQDFVTRDVGILLHVKPSVGADNKTITLSLTPEVSEISSDESSYTSPSGEVSIPQFTTRNLSTSVIIDSGQTVVLGGLIKETNTSTNFKIPVLGDIPILGKLFKKKIESVERKNLLIFVTATVLNEDEQRVAGTSEL